MFQPLVPLNRAKAANNNQPDIFTPKKDKQDLRLPFSWCSQGTNNPSNNKIVRPVVQHIAKNNHPNNLPPLWLPQPPERRPWHVTTCICEEFSLCQSFSQGPQCTTDPSTTNPCGLAVQRITDSNYQIETPHRWSPCWNTPNYGMFWAQTIGYAGLVWPSRTNVAATNSMDNNGDWLLLKQSLLLITSNINAVVVPTLLSS